jgi:voltage-gated potassium channel Kch
MRNLTADEHGTTAQPAPTPQRAGRCVVVGDREGDSRLAVAVAHRLLAGGAPVVVFAGRDGSTAGHVREAVVGYTQRATAPGLSPLLKVVALGDAGNLRSLLKSELHSQEVRCLLGMSNDPEQNLLTAIVAHEVDSELNVVLRAFDPYFADELEQRDAAMRVQRAYSVAHLAAPAFVAAAVSGGADDHVVTMRLGTRYVSICRVTVPEQDETDRFPAPRRLRTAGLRGRTARRIADEDRCHVLGRIRGEEMHPVHAADGTPLEPGEDVLVGGPLEAVLNLARGRCGSRRRAPGSTWVSAARARWRELAARVDGRRMRRGSPDPVLLLLVLVVSIATFLATPPQRVGELVYRWAGMAVGSADGAHSTTGSDELLGAAGLLAGGLALGLVTSMMSAHQIRRRVVDRERRRARQLRDHVIIVGTDDVGLRVAEILHELEIGAVLIEPRPERHGELVALTGDSAMQEIAERTPILTGALRETLAQAGVDRATAVIATSEDNLVNVEACLRAKRERGAEIRTVARIFDDHVTTAAAGTLGIDEVVAAVDQAAPAFADAALERDGVRSIEVDGVQLRAAVAPGRALSADAAHACDDARIGVLPLPTGQTMLVGPPDAVRRATACEDDAGARAREIQPPAQERATR